MEVEFTADITTPIKQNGIRIRVTDIKSRGGNFLGTLTVTQTRLVWAPKGVHVNTKKLEWEDFIKYMEDIENV